MKIINNSVELSSFLSNSNLNVLKFGAEWCAPCKNLRRTIGDIEVERDDVNFAEIDVDTYPDSLDEYGIKSIPVMVFYMDGLIVDKTIGAMSKQQLINKIEENLKK